MAVRFPWRKVNTGVPEYLLKFLLSSLNMNKISQKEKTIFHNSEIVLSRFSRYATSGDEGHQNHEKQSSALMTNRPWTHTFTHDGGKREPSLLWVSTTHSKKFSKKSPKPFKKPQSLKPLSWKIENFWSRHKDSRRRSTYINKFKLYHVKKHFLLTKANIQKEQNHIFRSKDILIFINGMLP